MNKEYKHSTISLIKTILFVFVLCSILVRTSLQSPIFFTPSDYELTDLKTEKDSNENENQEEDGKNEKIEIQHVNPYCSIHMFIKKHSIFWEQNLKWDFSLDTHIPPPKQA